MRSIKLLFHLIRLQIRSQLQYPVSFILEVISGVIIMGFYFVAFALTFTRFDNIGGWSLGEVAFVWGLAEFSFGTMDMIFSGFDYDAFGPMIRKGQFDQLLLRPVNITLQIFGSRFVLRRLGKMIEGLIIFIYSLTLLQVDWIALKIIYLPVLVISQV
ncbi:MAG TPA: ABC-2 family transporter protein, partial [Methanothrix soehngenii]|nr:ABC-2 family transporter protein [Methanothrix soehngenii]